MRLVRKTATYAVFDRVLGAEQFSAVHRYIRNEARLNYVHHVQYQDVWHPLDGMPLSSPQVVLEVEARGKRYAAKLGPELDGPTHYSYPSDCAIDYVVAVLLRKLDALVPWIGTPVVHWKSLIANAFVYPQGTSLDWHLDSGRYTGAFTFFAHDHWRPPWGGELLLADERVAPDRWNECGAFVVPRPNRLVILRGGTLHKVHKVTARAGENHRCAVSGFFAVRPLAELLELGQTQDG
jgi:hypothetical protein